MRYKYIQESVNLRMLVLKFDLRIVLAQPLYELVGPYLAAGCPQEGDGRP